MSCFVVDRISLGRWGEERAVQFFQERGAVVIGKNIRVVGGEIDLLVREGDEYVFVEVKTRRTHRFGHPETAITRTKILRMIRCAQRHLKQQRYPTKTRWRLDVVAITKNAQHEEIHHISSIDAPEERMIF